MKILITGSTGFVGRHLVPKLITEGHNLLELTVEPDISEKLYGSQTEKHIITDDQNALVLSVENFKPDCVIHLASHLTSFDDYNTLQKLLAVNISFFCRVLDALKNVDLQLFINTGTFAEYYKGDNIFDPAYLYSATKTASRSFLDYYSQVYNYKQATVVPYTIYGEQDTQKKIIDIIYDSIQSSTPIDLSPGEQVLDFIHVEDVANFYVDLIESNNKLEKKTNFQLGTGNGHTLKQIASIIEDITNKKTNINWGGKPYRKSDVMLAVANTNEINLLLSTKSFIPIEEGIKKYLAKKHE